MIAWFFTVPATTTSLLSEVLLFVNINVPAPFLYATVPERVLLAVKSCGLSITPPSSVSNLIGEFVVTAASVRRVAPFSITIFEAKTTLAPRLPEFLTSLAKAFTLSTPPEMRVPPVYVLSVRMVVVPVPRFTNTVLPVIAPSPLRL